MLRQRLASDLVWPVSRSRLRRAIGEERTGLRIAYFDALDEPSGIPLYVHWTTTATAIRLGLPSGLTGISIGVSPISRAQIDVVEPVLETEIMPGLAEWVETAESADRAWREQTHSRVWTIEDGRLLTTDRNGPA